MSFFVCLSFLGGLGQVDFLARPFAFVGDRDAPGREILLCERHEPHDAPVRGHAEVFGEEDLDETGITFVDGWLDVGGDRGDGEEVGRVEAAPEDEAGGVREGDENG